MIASRRIHEIDGLRFLAIFGVMVCHFRPPFAAGLDFLSLGWMGVDLFFIISGYLITGNLLALRGTARPYRVFYWRRALRIFPPYYLVLGALLLLTYYTGGFPDRLGVALVSLFLTSFTPWPPLPDYPWAPILYALHHGLHANVPMAIDHHEFRNFASGIFVLWSLSIEELFYLIWAPVILRCTRTTIAAVSIAAVVLCPVLRTFCHVPQFLEYFFFPARFDALTFGALMALLFAAYDRRKIERLNLLRTLRWSAAGSLVLLFLLGWYDGILQQVEVRSTLSFAAFGYTLLGIFFASIVGLCALRTGSDAWLPRLLRFRPFTYVGEISYMMYLTHLPVFVVVIQALSYLQHRRAEPTVGIGLVAIIGTIGLASLSWRYYEKPLLGLRNVVR